MTVPYKYVTAEELSPVADALQATQGLQGQELTNALKVYADDMEAQRGADQGPPLIIKALAVGGPQMLQEQLSGIGMDDAAATVGKWVNPEWQQQVGQAASGPLSDLSTWAANIGVTLPMVAEALLLRRGGMPMGKVASAALPGAAFVAQQRGATLTQMKDYGIDPDVANTYATSTGLLNGLLSEAQFAQKLIPFKIAPGMVLDRVLQSPLLKRAAQELGINALMSVEQGGMTVINNAAMEHAIQDMKKRHGDTWEPPQGYTPSDPMRAMGLGLGVGLATRAATTATLGVYVNRQNRLEKAKLTEELGKATIAEWTAGGGKLDSPEFLGEIRTGQTESEQLRKDFALSENAGKIAVTDAAGRVLTNDGNKPRAMFTGITMEHRLAAVDSASDMKLLSMANLIRKKQGAEPLVEGVDPRTLRSLVKSNLGLITEGPVWEGAGDDRVLKFQPVLGGGVNVKEDVEWAAHAGKYADMPIVKMVAPEGIQPIHAEILDTVRSSVKSSALLTAGFDPAMAKRPEFLQPGTTMEQWYHFLSDKVTRQQYHAAALDTVYHADELSLKMLGGTALAHKNPMLYGTGVHQPHLVVGGVDVTANLPETLGSIRMAGAAMGLRPYFHIVRDLANAKLPMQGIDMTFMHLNNLKDATIQTYYNARDYVMGAFPKAWGRGMQRQDLTRLISYYRMAPETRESLVMQKQFDLENVPVKERLRVLASRVVERGRLNATPEDILKVVGSDRVQKGWQAISDYMFRMSGLPMDRYVEKYIPMYHEYLKLPEGDKTSLADFFKRKHDEGRMGDHAEDMDKVVNLGDTVRSLQQKYNTNFAQGDAMYEFHRAEDREFLSRVSTETDIVKQFDMMAHRVISKRIYEGASPSIQAASEYIVNAARNSNRPGLAMAVQKVMQDYLNSAMGAPELGISIARKLNLRNPNTYFGGLLNSHLERMQKWFGHLHDFSGPITPYDIVQETMGFLYPLTLGIPFNFKAPLENILSQSPLAQAFGPRSYWRGMGKLYSATDMSYRNELTAMKLHSIGYDADIAHIMAKTGIHDKLNQAAMSLFTRSDIEQRLHAGATALYNWNMLEPMLKADPELKNLSKAQIGSILFTGKTPAQLGINDKVIISQGSEVKRGVKGFKDGAPPAFSGMEDFIFKLIQKGDTVNAKDSFIRYAVDLSGFRYGRGGTPKVLGGVLKPLLMFSSYPINYLEWMNMMLKPKNKLMRNYASVFMVQALAASLASAMGVATADRWLTAGPFPTQIGLGGPITSLLNSMLGAVVTPLQYATAEILPGVSEEERARVHGKMLKALNTFGHQTQSLFDVSI